MSQRRRPTIVVNNRDLRDITGEATQAIVRANRPTPSLYSFGSELVRLRSVDGHVVLEAMTPDRLINHLASVAAWRTLNAKGESSPVFPPARVARNILAEPDSPVPPIRRVIDAPGFAADGSLIVDDGYHPEAEVFLSLSSSLYIPSPEDPTPGKVKTAKKILLGKLLADFPFVGEADRAHAIGAMLMPFVRSMITGPTPLHLVNAPTKGTGKTLLAEAIAHPAAGKPGVSTEARIEEEWRKRIGAFLQPGPAVIWIDNIKHHLDSSALPAVLTEDIWVDRLLGRNDQTIRYPNTALWIATGNGVTLSDELARRTIPINLDAGVEHPYRRATESFRIPDLRSWMQKHRGLLIWACVTLIQRWIQDGRPLNTTTIGSYESWAETIGGILGNVGIEGFLDNLDDFYAASDPETLAWNNFVTEWWHEYADAVKRPGELLDTYDSLKDDFLVLGDKDDRIRASSLGNRLLNQRDRIFVGYKLMKVDTNQGGNRWKLQRA